MKTPLRLALLLAPWGCRAAPVTEVERVLARDEARLVMERYCGDCHVPDSPDAFPPALAVYDLREAEWAARMSEVQLNQLAGRLESGPFFDPFDARNEHRTPPPAATPAEVAVVSHYVDLELRHRRAPAR